MEQRKVAFIVGGHTYDVPALQDTLATFKPFRFYPQSIEDLIDDRGQCLDDYAALVFYGMPMYKPEGKEKAFLENLSWRNQGIVVLHHAILGYPGWQPWIELMGLVNEPFEYYHDRTISLTVTNPNHAITRGLSHWTTVDETYLLHQQVEASADILVTTDDPKSLPTIAWTRQHGLARVFCCTLGHDAVAYANEGFQTLLHNGILWAAGEIE